MSTVSDRQKGANMAPFFVIVPSHQQLLLTANIAAVIQIHNVIAIGVDGESHAA